MRTEMRVTGFGGQGIILAGYIIGKAAAVYDDKHATMTQAYGPEARGSACSSQVIVRCTDSLSVHSLAADPGGAVTGGV